MQRDDERLSGALQENILAVLCYDAAHCKIVRHAVKPQLFESSVFREVAGLAIDFIDQYGEPIGDHLADHLEDVLTGEDQRKASNYKRLLANLVASHEAQSVNGEYVVNQVQKFVRAQNIKSALVSAVEAVDDGRVDDAAVAMQKGLAVQEISFSSGTRLNDPKQAIRFKEKTDSAPYPTGIEALDRFGVGPARKTLFLLMAPLNRGKSWWLMNLGKWALINRLSVLHVTLEMSEEECAGRYLQCFYSWTKEQVEARRPQFVMGRGEESGRIMRVEFERLQRPSLDDPGAVDMIKEKVAADLSRRPPLIIKEFPTGQLTVGMFEAYLDNLERFENVVPDLILIDYADLFALDPKNLRAELGELVKRLRGIAVARNTAVVTATQTNREGLKAKLIDESNLSEDVSKGFTADKTCTYNQTDAEFQMQLARIYVSKNRQGRARMTALIAQSYDIGQFCLDSVPLQQNYWQMLRGDEKDEDD